MLVRRLTNHQDRVEPQAATPYAGITTADSAEHTRRTGLRRNTSQNATVRREGTREDAGGENRPADGLMLRAQMRW